MRDAVPSDDIAMPPAPRHPRLDRRPVTLLDASPPPVDYRASLPNPFSGPAPRTACLARVVIPGAP